MIVARPRWQRALLVLASAALGTWSGHALSETATSQASVAEVYASVSRGSVFRLYYNNLWSEPQAAAIEPGQWTVYRFPVPSRLIALRFDPSDEAGAEVLVKSVTIRSSGSAISIPTDRLEHWLTQNLKVSYDPDAAATRVAVDRIDAYMMGAVDVDVTHRAVPLLAHFRLNLTTLLWCASVWGAGLLLLSIGRRDLAIAAAVAAIAFLAVSASYYAATRALAWPAPRPDVSQTVGHQSYFGRPKAAELRALNVAAVSAMAMALVLGAWLRRRVPGEAPILTASADRLSRREWIFLAASVAVFAIASVPAAASMQQAALTARHNTDFDSVNFFVWQYLYAHGAVPFKDFWFPYSGMYDQLAPLYPELSMRWGHLLAVFIVTITSGYFVADRSKAAVLGLVAVWMYLEAMGIAVARGSLRYFLCASVVALAAVALRQRSLVPAVALGVWTAYVFQEEVSQVVYAAPGVLLIVAAAIVRPPQGARVAVLRRLAASAAAFLAAAVVYFASLVIRGQFREWWEFVTTVDIMSNYSAWPSEIATWFVVPRTVDQFLVTATIALAVGGILQAVWTRFKDVYLVVPAALGIASIMLLQKQVIRQGIAGQILAVPILGLALLVVQQLRLRPQPARSAAFTALCAALIVTCFTWSLPPARARVAGYLDVATGLASDIEYSVFAAERWAPARAAYFSPASMMIAGLRGDEFASRARQLTGLGPSDNVFVLGDHSDVYLALDRPAAFYPNLYNQSPLFCQRHTIEWVRDRNPRFLFWNPKDEIFDGVPNAARVPLLYNYAAAEFVPLGTLGTFDVLRRRAATEPPAVDYWHARLGGGLDLGYIPASSDVLSEDDAAGSHQMRVIVARVAAPSDGASYGMSLQLAGRPFAVRFKGRTGVTEYPIAIDRLPLASAATVLGLAPAILAADAGVVAELRTLRLRSDRLY